MNIPTEGPFVITAQSSFLCAVLEDGNFAGWPIALAIAYQDGGFTHEDVRRRGWVYAPQSNAGLPARPQ